MNATPDSALLESAKSGDPQAQTRVGIGLFSRGEHAEAHTWLEQAAHHDVPEACNLLGLMHLNGIGVPQQPTLAAGYLQRAADRGLKEACYTLGNLMFNGIGVPVDEARASDFLLQAAELHHLPALRTLGLLHCLAEHGSTQNAVALYCLRQAAQGGDALSQYLLATELLWDSARQQQAEGLYWLQQAANRQVHCAVARLQRLLTGPEREHWQLLAQMYRPGHALGSRPTLSVPDLQKLAQNNPAVADTLVPGTVWQITNVLAPLVCEHFMNLAMPVLAPSHVIDPDSGKPLTNEARTSSSMYFSLSMYDFIVGLTLKRITKLGEKDITHAEPLAVLRYLPGQQYQVHYDYFTNSGDAAQLVEMRGGQRTTTVFVYLNDVEAGGETDFPLLHVHVSPAQGKAVKFMNLDSKGEPNTQTLHAGKPVIRGEKWLLTVWFRQRPFVWGKLQGEAGA